MRWTLCMLMASFTPLASTLENSIIGDPEVQCGSESISLAFKTQTPFGGKIFVKGHVGESPCVQMGNSNTDQKFSIRFDQCGVRRERQINGVTIASTVIVSFHSIFITRIDRAYRVSCFYMEATKTVNQEIDVSSLTTQLLEAETEMPTCRYEILAGGPSGQVVQYAKIGDTVYHKWSCSAPLEDVYCMRVHSCTVYDGQGGPPVTVIDVNGCQVDDSVLKNLDYTSDLTAGQQAQAFQFADRSGLYFNCQIQLTLKDRQYGCSVSQPDCSNGVYSQIPVQASPKAKESEEYNSPESASSSDGSEHESGYTNRVTPSSTQYPTPPPTIPTVRQDYVAETSGSSASSSSSINTPSPYFSGATIADTTHPKNVHPPGVSPTYAQIAQFNDTEIAYQDDLLPLSSTPSPQYAATVDEGYAARLIKRDLMKNRTEIVRVADFDLPERSLIVFGLEEQSTQGEEAPVSREESSSRLLIDNREGKTCFTTARLSLLIAICLLSLGSLLISLSLIVVRQRRMLASPYIK